MTDNPLPWQSVFCGREKELEILKTAWERVSSENPSPQFVVFVADSGLGKTRIVQEFYNWLSTAVDGAEGNGYWPDKLVESGNNLVLNPEPAECIGANSLHYLWWALRMADPQGRNPTRGGITASIDILKAHLQPFALASFRNERIEKLKNEAAKDIAVEAANAITFNLFGLAKVAVEHGSELADLLQQDAHKNFDPEAAGRQIRESLVDLTIADFGKVLDYDAKRPSRPPAIIILDDAHWTRFDQTTLNFVDRLIRTSISRNWPLLFIATHWEEDWHANSEKDALTLSKLWTNLLSEKSSPHFISKAKDLNSMAYAGFPGLTDTQAALIASKADGNPRLMSELLNYLHQSKGFFLDRNINNALSTSGELAIQDQTFDLHKLIERRMANAPEVVRLALGLSSAQGTQYIQPLSAIAGHLLNESGVKDGLSLAERPHAFVASVMPDIGEFSHRAYWEVAGAQVARLFGDTSTINKTLRQGFCDLAGPQADFPDLRVSARETAWILGTALLLNEESTPKELEIAAWCFAHAVKNLTEKFAYVEAANLATKFAECIVDHRIDIHALPFQTAQDIGDAAFNNEHYESAKSIFEELYQDIERDTDLKQIEDGKTPEPADIASRLGRIAYIKGEYQSAFDFHNRALDIIHQAKVHKDTPFFNRELAVALSNFADAKEQLGEVQEAKSLYVEAAQLMEPIANNTPPEKYSVTNIGIISNLSQLLDKLEGAKSATHFAEKGYNLSKQLTNAWDNPEFKELFANQCWSYADILSAQHNLEMATPILIEGREAALSANDYLKTVSATRTLIWASHRLSQNMYAQYALSESEKLSREAEGLARNLSDETNSTADLEALMAVLGQLGKISFDLHGPEEGLQHSIEAKNIAKRITEKVSNDGTIQNYLDCLINAAFDALEANKAEGAMEMAETAIATAREHAKTSNTYEARSYLSSALACMCDLLSRTGNVAQAIPFAEEALEISERLSIERGEPWDTLQLASQKKRLGLLLEASEGSHAAIDLLHEAVNELRSLEKKGTNRYVDDYLIYALGALADTIKKLDGEFAALPVIKEEVKLSREIIQIYDDPYFRNHLSNSLSRLANSTWMTHGPGAAREFAEETVEICRELLEDYGSPSTQEDLGSSLLSLGSIVEEIEGPCLAIPLFLEAEEILRPLSIGSRSTFAADQLASALERRSAAEVEEYGPARAKQAIEEANYLRRRDAKQTDGLAEKSALAINLGYYGKNHFDLNEKTAAKHIYSEQVELTKEICEQTGAIYDLHSYGLALGNLASAIEDIDGPEAALPSYRVSVRTLSEVAGRSQTIDNRSRYADALLDLGRAIWNAKGANDALESYQTALEIERSVTTQSGTASQRSSSLYIKVATLSDVLSETQGERVAFKLRKEQFEIAQENHQNFETIETQTDLAYAACRLGDSIKSTLGYKAAIEYYLQYYDLIQKNLERNPTHDNQSQMATAGHRVGNATLELNGPTHAYSFFEKAMEYTRQLVEEGYASNYDLSIALDGLALVVRARDGSASSQPHYLEAEETARTSYRESPTLSNSLNLSEILLELGHVERALGNAEKAAERMIEAVSLAEENYEKDTTYRHRKHLLSALVALGDAQLEAGIDEKADKTYQICETLTIQALASLETDELDYALTLSDRAYAWFRLNNHENVLSTLDKSLELLNEIEGKESTNFSRTVIRREIIKSSLEFELDIPTLSEAVAVMSQKRGRDHPWTLEGKKLLRGLN